MNLMSCSEMVVRDIGITGNTRDRACYYEENLEPEGLQILTN